MPRERIYSRGESIGPYQVVRTLATGAASTVYEATPDPSLRRDLIAQGIQRVALKVARLETPAENRHERRLLLERLDREFRTLFGLSQLRGHSYVVGVYDFGLEDGLPYYAMEFVEGLTLDKALEARPRIGQILNVFAKLCGAAAYLHNLGIVHRDIKPSNVMLRYDGADPVLIDFGICLPPFGRRLTAPHDLLGTPAYVSPEYAAHWLEGKKAKPYLAEPTDDVWALGMVLYEVLTGGVPWKQPAERREALMREIARGRVPHVCKVNPEVPRPLGDATMRLLERNLRRRPKNGSEVLNLLGKAGEEIGEVLTPVPKRRHPEWEEEAPPEGTADQPRGHVLALQLGGLLVLLVGIAVGVVIGTSSPGGAARAPGAPPAAETSRDPGMNAPVYGTVERDDREDEDPPRNGAIAKGRALPRQPYRGQMLAPCPAPYVEMIGACWKKIRGVRVDGTPAACSEDMVEVPGRNGPECYLWVEAPTPNTTKSAKDGGTE